MIREQNKFQLEIKRYIEYMKSSGIKTVVGMNKYLTQNDLWDDFHEIKTMNTYASGSTLIGISKAAYKMIVNEFNNHERSHIRLEKQVHIK